MDFPFYDAPNTAAIVCCHIIDDGKPVLYVSHDLESIMTLCNKVVWLEHGKIIDFGETDRICKEYYKKQMGKELKIKK